MRNRNPRASTQLARIQKNKIDKILNTMTFETFVHYIWSASTNGDGFSYPANQWIQGKFQSQTPGKEAFLAQWELETLVSYFLSYPRKMDKKRRAYPMQAGLLGKLIYSLRRLENNQTFLGTNSASILDLMPRLLLRQTYWQERPLYIGKVARAWMMFSGPVCRNLIEDKFGAPFDELALTWMGLFAQYSSHPNIDRPGMLKLLKVDEDGVTRTLRHVSIDKHKAVVRQREQTRGLHQIAYAPSILRSYPIVSSRTGYFCPMPSVLLERLSNGLFYDVFSVAAARSEYGRAFEAEIYRLITYFLDRTHIVLAEEKYSKTKLTPDIRVFEHTGELRAIFEVKAKRIPFKLRNFMEYKEVYSPHKEIVKGILQIWDYCSYLRRSGKSALHPDAFGAVVTLEPWSYFDFAGSKRFMDIAIEEANRRHIPDAARLPVQILSVNELEDGLACHEVVSIFEVLSKRGGQEWQHRQNPAQIARSVAEIDEYNPFPWGKILEDSFPRLAELNFAGD